MIDRKMDKSRVDVLSKQNGNLYRVEYKPEAVFDSDVVVSRAQSKLGKAQYNILTNNCEHFASWCKTGVGECKQVESVKSVLVRTGAKTIMSTWAEAGAVNTVRDPFVALASKTVGKTVTCTVASTVVMGSELYSMNRYMKKAQGQFINGDISWQELCKIAI